MHWSASASIDIGEVCPNPLSDKSEGVSYSPSLPSPQEHPFLPANILDGRQKNRIPHAMQCRGYQACTDRLSLFAFLPVGTVCAIHARLAFFTLGPRLSIRPVVALMHTQACRQHMPSKSDRRGQWSDVVRGLQLTGSPFSPVAPSTPGSPCQRFNVQ